MPILGTILHAYAFFHIPFQPARITALLPLSFLYLVVSSHSEEKNIHKQSGYFNYDAVLP